MLLAATALRRLDRQGDALALLSVIEDDITSGGDDLLSGRFCLERAVSLAALDDVTAGRSFGLARAFFLRGETAATADLSELALQEAIAAWLEGDRTLAVATLARAEDGASPETRAGARRLGGEIAASDLDFKTQLELEDATLRELATLDERDVWIEACTLHRLAHVAVELDERHATKFARSRAEHLPWTSATMSMQYDLLRYLAWYESLRGDAAEGAALMARALAIAPSERDRVKVLVDEARVAKMRGDARAEERLETASRAAEAVRWADAPFAALEVLLELSHLFAGIDADRSRTYAQRFRDLRRYGMSLVYAPPVSVARERFWTGLAALDRGERDLARGHLRHAYDFWSTVRFLPRATLAAIALYDVSASADVRAFLVEMRLRWPDTFLSGRIDAALGETAAPRTRP